MSRTVISVENVSKLYRLGAIGSRTLRDDFTRTWARMRGKPDPLARVDAGAGTPDGDMLWALRDVSFEVKQGEVLGIIGRNGAGKSTLLKILSRVTAPTSGEIKVKGRIASLLEVGTGFHPELTGRENIFLNGAILGMRRAEIQKKFDEIVAFSEVEKFIDTPVKRYSSGMYVRLAFAVAAHLDPEILIVDEVLAVGDAAFQKKCLGKMGDVAHEGRTVLFVSHNMEAIRQLCSRCVLFDRGQTLMDGSSAQVVTFYLKQSSEKIQSIYTLSEDARHSAKDKALLICAEIRDANDRQNEFIRFGEPFSIHMLWQHRAPIPAVAYAVRMFNEREIFVSAINTLNADLDIEGSGLHSVDCRIKNNILAPGKYTVSIGCYVRPHTSVHVIDPCVGLVVLEVPYNKEYVFNIVGNPLIALQGEWQVI